MMYDYEIHYLLMQNPHSSQDSLPISKIKLKNMCDELLGRLAMDNNKVKENSTKIDSLYKTSTANTFDMELNTQTIILKDILTRSIRNETMFSDAEYIYIQHLKSKFLFIYPESWFLQKDIVFSYEILNKYLPEFANDVNNVYTKDIDYISTFHFYNTNFYSKAGHLPERLFFVIDRRKIVDLRNILKSALVSEKDDELKKEISRTLTIFNSVAERKDCILIFYKTS